MKTILLLVSLGLASVLTSCNTLVGVSHDLTAISNTLTGAQNGENFRPMFKYKNNYDPATNTYKVVANQ